MICFFCTHARLRMYLQPRQVGVLHRVRVREHGFRHVEQAERDRAAPHERRDEEQRVGPLKRQLRVVAHLLRCDQRKTRQ